jgi:rhodanese-related sulfurtransferase
MDRAIEFISTHHLLVAAFVALLAAFIFTEIQRGGRRISPADLTRMVNSQQARIIDLRNMPEFRDGHITGSENMPYSQIADKAATLASDGQPIIFVCAMGQTSGNAARSVKQAGLNEVSILGGGISTWRQQGLPLVR